MPVVLTLYSVKLAGLTNAEIDGNFSALASATDSLLDVPSNPQIAAYTLALTDRGKSVDTNAAVTVPPNTSVAFPIGTVVSITNVTASAINITQGVGVTLRQAGTANTGNRTLAAYSMATIRKIATDTWLAMGLT